MKVTAKWVQSVRTCGSVGAEKFFKIFPSGEMEVTVENLERLEKGDADLEVLAQAMLTSKGITKFRASCAFGEIIYRAKDRELCKECRFDGESCAARELWNLLVDGFASPETISALGAL